METPDGQLDAQPGAQPDALSDAELIARVRNGDLEAYGELYARHHHAAERMARQLVPANDADDLASDAFAKVLDALRGGGGPDVSFRAYLLTTVRRVHVDRIRSGKKVQTTDDIAAYEREPETFDDPTVTGFESGAAAKAFASLPERWQAVLWHTEVEGEKPAAIAPLLGLTANGVSALAYRAREGLRQAYLQQHLADVAGDRCRWTTERLGAYVRGGLTKRENRNVREHMDDCAKCTAVYLELVEVNSALPALLAPALLGTAGIGYLAAASGAKAGLVGFFVTGWRKVTENSTRSAAGAGAVVVVAVAAVLAAMALTGNDTPPAAINQPNPQPTQAQPTQPPAKPTQPPVKPPVKPPSANPTQPPASNPTQAPTTAPTTQPTSPPTTAPTPTPTQTTPVPTPPPSTPTPPPPTPTTPVLDEGLVTISIPRGGGSPVMQDTPAVRSEQTRADAGIRFVVTIKTPAGNTNPVVIGLKYGAELSWPLGTNPPGWTCDRASGNCTATDPANPKPLAVTFDAPTGGSAADRTFTVSGRTGRLYDSDAATVEAQASTDENLLKIVDGKADPDVHHRILTVAPRTNRTSVTLKITYGDALEWPIAASPAGWKCSPKTSTCTAANPDKPAPLPAAFDVPDQASAGARTYTVAAKADLVSDADSEVLPGLKQDESLLQILTPTPHTDPNPFVYNRFLKVNGAQGRQVELDISWGRNLAFMPSFDLGWTCERTSDIRRATCRTNNYKKPLNSEWNAWLPGNGSNNTITVHARVGGREDTDTAQIPPSSTRR
ncbi:sigma-70 family RNA polymerase sigma factor [Kribbella shirazensis]|uniref:RNA polymerase sigma factor (Sigma-70 family) n=1 Tax=Kribbella shirazensis TaxID=1105143 RepID=A0A7X5VAX1_9ACTN|nr:sigma-70 family RNA polymerase sigma factor [Kribbella shirazensis]NIK57436.1 RNA polymerase sigma factor (sigma-70 family) [Kribbella shirazensis]